MKSFKTLNLKEKLWYIGIMAIYPLILLYGSMGKYFKLFNSRAKQITASVLTVCLVFSMIPAFSFNASAAAAPTVTYSIGKTYKYAVSKKFITNLSYGTSSPSTSGGSSSISGSKVTLSTGSSSDKLGKLVYASVAVKVTVPANSTYSIVHKIAASATRVSTGSTKASVFLYDLGKSDKSSSLTFYPYDDDENKNGSDPYEMKYTFGGKGTESISLSGSDDAIIYLNETNSAKTFTHYYGVLIAIQYGSTKNNRMQSTFTFSNTVTSVTNTSNNGVAYMAFDEPWTAKSGTVPEGNYYLKSNFVGTESYYINSKVNLCLNGKALTWSEDLMRFRVNDGGTFGLYDCDGGSVTADEGDGAIANHAGGTVNMHGGTLTNVRYPGNAIANLAGGTINVYGGTAVAEDGSGITVGTGTVNVYGGTVNGASDGIYNGTTGTVNVSGGNVIGSSSSGINNRSTGKVTVSGTANVTGKTQGIYNYRNGTITVSGGTVTGAEDGIYMTESAGTLNVTGGTITGTERYGIDGYGTISILAPAKVVGGKYGVCCGSTAPILISATVEATGDSSYVSYGIYYYGSSTLDFSGTVTVSGTNGYGVFNCNAGTVNITGTVNATESYIQGVYNNGSGTVNILDGANICSAEYIGVQNLDDGTVEMKGGTVTGSTYGIHNSGEGVIKMSGGTVKSTASKGIYNGNRGTLHITGGTVQSVEEYALSNFGTAYISNNPTISGATADIYCNSNNGSLYAQSNDTTPVAYSGGNLSIYVNQPIDGSIVVNNITDNNKNSFSLTYDDYYLEQSGDDLVLVKVQPHIHTDVEGEFTKLTKKSGSLESGKYYLADNFTATGNLIVSAGNTVTLCLNGNTLDFDGIAETVINRGTLYICDCAGGGILSVSGELENNGTAYITGGKIFWADGGPINNLGSLTLSDGTVEAGGTAYALSNFTNGTVNMSGGTIKGYRGIYNDSDADNAVTISGGTITTTGAHAIYNNASGTVTVSDGTISSESQNAVANDTDGAIIVSGGSISSGSENGISNADVGTVSISGGTVSGKYAVYNYDGGTVTVSGNANIIGSTYGIYDYYGGNITVSGGTVTGATTGIVIYRNTGILNVTGGTITGTADSGIKCNGTLSALAPAKIIGGKYGIYLSTSTANITVSATVETTADSSRGINYYGSGVVDFSGTINVPGSESYGIYQDNGTANITGIVNVTGEYSYGVYFSSTGTVNITGTVNTAESGSYGVSNVGSGTVNILDGANICSAKNVGVQNLDDGTVDMKGGTVTGRTYGIHNYGAGVIKISGGTVKATIREGIYNGHSGTLHITGGTVQSIEEYALSNMGKAYISNNPTISGATADIYYNSNYGSLYAQSNATTPVAYSGGNLSIYVSEAIEGDTVVYNITDNNKNSFSLTDDTYILKQEGNNLILALKPTHTHSFSYTASGATITATCVGEGTCDYSGSDLTLTIIAPEMTVFGDGKAANATLSAASIAGQETLPAIKYVGRGSTVYAESNVAPTVVGKYTAKLTVGGKTITVDYKIESVAPTYIVTIPAEVTLGETATIKAENVSVGVDKEVQIKLTSTSGKQNAFTLADVSGNTLQYKVTAGGADIKIGDTVLLLNSKSSTTESTTLSFSLPQGTSAPGTYKGTITFTIATEVSKEWRND